MGNLQEGILEIIDKTGLGSILDILTSVVDLLKDTATFLKDTSELMSLSDALLDRINTPVEILIGTSSGYMDSIAYRVYDAMIPFGAIFMMIFFGLRLIELITNDEINIENFVKLFGYMILMLLFLNNGYAIMLKCYDAICSKDSEIIQSILPQMQANFGSQGIFTATSPGGILHELVTDIPEDSGDYLAWLKNLFNSLNRLVFVAMTPVLAFIPALLIRISFLTAVAMRAIKIAIHMSFSPIAFASIFDDSISTSKAVNHFKKILSLFLQGPLILIMMRITSYAISSSSSGYFSPLIALFFTCTMMKRAIKGSEQRADEMLGVN